MLLCFGFYNVAADADPGAFIEAESRNGVAYRAGCRTFGWECLGNYACTGQPARSLPFGYVHAYVIDGSDPAEALRAAEEASGPPGFAEVVAEGRSFMTSQEDTAVAWLHATGDQPRQPTPLKDRCIVVRLHNGAEAPEHIGHPGWLGRFNVEGAADARRRRSAYTASTMLTARMPAAAGCSRRSSPAARRSRRLRSTGACGKASGLLGPASSDGRGAVPPNSKQTTDQEGSLTESSALSVKAGQSQTGTDPATHTAPIDSDNEEAS